MVYIFPRPKFSINQTGIFVTVARHWLHHRKVSQTKVNGRKQHRIRNTVTALSQKWSAWSWASFIIIQFLEAQGENVENMKVILFEDKSSAMLSNSNDKKWAGTLSEGTKHISIHKFFIKQHLNPEGKLELRQCTTIEQIANGFTKPFFKLINEFIRFLVDIGMKVVDDEDNGKSKSITLLHDGTGV